MTEDHHEVKKIEDEKAFSDFGKMGLLIFKGAIDEGATLKEAFMVTAAYFRGMFGGVADLNEDDEDKKDA